MTSTSNPREIRKMEPAEITIEETAGQNAVVVTEAATTASEAAVETVNAVPEKAETAEETAVEAVNTMADDAVATEEIEQVEMSTTSIPASPIQDESSTCPVSGCDIPMFAIIGAVVVIALLILAILAKKKKKPGQKAAPGKPGKSNGPDMVEIYVGNLSYDMTDAQLRREFERFGVVKSARVITHRTNSKSKGYGFVEMPHRKEALIGIKALDNSEVLGRRIRVNEARANTRPPER